jgi:hypothetical protein
MTKILEKFISIQLTNHQYGFQKEMSTEHTPFHLTNSIYSALNKKKFCIGLFFDLRNAFDVCSHSILLRKLRKYGIIELNLPGLKVI